MPSRLTGGKGSSDIEGKLPHSVATVNRVIHPWVGSTSFGCSTVSPVLVGNLAEAAVQLGKMVELPNKGTPNPGLRADESPCICHSFLSIHWLSDIMTTSGHKSLGNSCHKAIKTAGRAGTAFGIGVVTISNICHWVVVTIFDNQCTEKHSMNYSEAEGCNARRMH